LNTQNRQKFLLFHLRQTVIPLPHTEQLLRHRHSLPRSRPIRLHSQRQEVRRRHELRVVFPHVCGIRDLHRNQILNPLPQFRIRFRIPLIVRLVEEPLQRRQRRLRDDQELPRRGTLVRRMIRDRIAHHDPQSQRAHYLLLSDKYSNSYSLVAVLYLSSVVEKPPRISLFRSTVATISESPSVFRQRPGPSPTNANTNSSVLSSYQMPVTFFSDFLNSFRLAAATRSSGDTISIVPITTPPCTLDSTPAPGRTPGRWPGNPAPS